MCHKLKTSISNVPKHLINISTTPMLTLRKSREVVCATGCISHLKAAHFNSAIFCSGHYNYIPIAAHFTYTGGMEARVELVCSGIKPGPPAHISEYATEWLTP